MSNILHYDPEGERVRSRARAKLSVAPGGHWLWTGAGSRDEVSRRMRAAERPVAIRRRPGRPVIALRDGRLVNPALAFRFSTPDEMVRHRAVRTCEVRGCVHPDHHRYEARPDPVDEAVESGHVEAARPEADAPVRGLHPEYGDVVVIATRPDRDKAWIMSIEHGIDDVVTLSDLTPLERSSDDHAA